MRRFCTSLGCFGGNKRTRAAAGRAPPGAGLGADQVPSCAQSGLLTLAPCRPPSRPLPSRPLCKSVARRLLQPRSPATHPSPAGFCLLVARDPHTHEHTQVHPHHNREVWEIAEQNPGFRGAVVAKVRRAQPEFQPEPRLAEPARDSELVALRVVHREVLAVGAPGGRPRLPRGASAQRRGAGVQGNEPSAGLGFCVFSEVPRPSEGAAGRPDARSSGSHPWPVPWASWFMGSPATSCGEVCRAGAEQTMGRAAARWGWGGGGVGASRGSPGRRGPRTRVAPEARGAPPRARAPADVPPPRGFLRVSSPLRFQPGAGNPPLISRPGGLGSFRSHCSEQRAGVGALFRRCPFKGSHKGVPSG